MARQHTLEQGWDYPLYNIGYCFNRDVVVQTNISNENNKYRQATPFNWINENKKSELKILEERIIAFNNPDMLERNIQYALNQRTFLLYAQKIGKFVHEIMKL